MKRTAYLNRRELLKVGVGASLATVVGCSADYDSPDNWGRGKLSHLIPLVSHQSMNIKASFSDSLKKPPQLKIDGQVVAGQQTDSRGRFWQFVATNLKSNHRYKLQIIDHRERPLCDVWPLATFPAPQNSPKTCKVISYTCAGGPDLPILPGGKDAFKPVAYRQKLFDLMLRERPDIVIANGDHIYWDYRSWVENFENSLAKASMQWFLNTYGEFDEAIPILGTSNEVTLTAIADSQISGIYGVRFRSTPVFFVTDDHDYFENDDASPALITFPPKPFNTELRNTLQHLYFPEFIVEEPMPAEFPGIVENQQLLLSTHFGNCRFGDLFECVLYDCGGMLSLGEGAGLVPPVVESWLIAKTADDACRQFAHIPSHPVGWTAGKWREWYPDLLSSTGSLLAAVDSDDRGGKYAWQMGWWDQHQRLLAALTAQRNRKPLIISGDLHVLGMTEIVKSADLDCADNPITSVLSGPVGVGGLGWLSRARGVAVQVPENLETIDILQAEERNGFTLLEIDQAAISIVQYRCPQGYVDASNLVLEKASQLTL